MALQAYQGDDGRYYWRLLDEHGVSFSITPGRIPAAGRKRDPKIVRAVQEALQRIAEEQAATAQSL